jgi:hypothetical protein
LHTEKSQRIDYTTIDHLLTYFNQYFHVTAADLLVWEQSSYTRNGTRENVPVEPFYTTSTGTFITHDTTFDTKGLQ